MLITVIMAVRNEERFIDEAIFSIVNQSYHDWILLIIDDGSTDSTYQKLYKWSELDNRIKIFKNLISLGLASSLNALIEMVETEWIVRCDGDDINLPDRFERLVQIISKKRYDVIGSSIFLLRENDATILNKSFYQLKVAHPVYDFSLIKNPMSASLFFHPTVAYRKDAVKKLNGYDPIFHRSQDKDLWIRCYLAGLRLFNVADPLVVYRMKIHSSSLAIAKQEFDALRRIASKNDIKLNFRFLSVYFISVAKKLIFNLIGR